MALVVPEYLDLLDEQREAIFADMGEMPERILWYRPGRKVWSIGEHLDHTRVINKCTRRIITVYSVFGGVLGRLRQDRAYQTMIDNVYQRPRFPMGVGWIWPPKYKPTRPVSVGFLHEALRKEHDAMRRFYASHDERVLGHIVLPDPVIGALNLVQWLRVQGYHDEHHFGRIRVRLADPNYATDNSDD